jgi:hypothetical protein
MLRRLAEGVFSWTAAVASRSKPGVIYAHTGLALILPTTGNVVLIDPPALTARAWVLPAIAGSTGTRSPPRLCPTARADICGHLAWQIGARGAQKDGPVEANARSGVGRLAIRGRDGSLSKCLALRDRL